MRPPLPRPAIHFEHRWRLAAWQAEGVVHEPYTGVVNSVLWVQTAHKARPGAIAPRTARPQHFEGDVRGVERADACGGRVKEGGRQAKRVTAAKGGAAAKFGWRAHRACMPLPASAPEPSKLPQVTLFEHPDFQGASQSPSSAGRPHESEPKSHWWLCTPPGRGRSSRCGSDQSASLPDPTPLIKLKSGWRAQVVVRWRGRLRSASGRATRR